MDYNMDENKFIKALKVAIPYQLEPREITKKPDPKRIAIASSFLLFLGISGLAVPLFISLTSKELTKASRQNIAANTTSKKIIHANRNKANTNNLDFLHFNHQITLTNYGLLNHSAASDEN